ncbi:MAG: PIG-L family deacetylase [Saprospiraceae bacterium]|nr:PIG-L family deacetylase [Saprospiraceae bacterium]
MRFSILISFFFLSISIFAQKPKQLQSSEIFEAIKKLNVLGSVMYVAAHPDDENTHLITYLANQRHYDTRYISLTRGDGGQNLIGSETQDLLGVIRTQELLAARRLDGGLQSFSRANDFGYSKTPDETLELWDKKEVLSDLVWAIRQYQPDVIINRFTNTTDRPNHGHHTASAILSLEAFDIVNDNSKFPEQLNYVSTWQPKKLYQNASWWWYGSQEAFAKVDKSAWSSLDIGVYYPSKGLSNREIAAESRSQHRCQGMGTLSERGTYMEYFQPLKGDMKGGDLFEGINTTWSRVEGGKPIEAVINDAINNFKFENPSNIIPQLLKAKSMIEALPNGNWRNNKLKDIKEVIKQCLGLYLEASANTYAATPGDSVSVNLEVTNRSEQPISVQSIIFMGSGRDTTINFSPKFNTPFKFKTKIKIPENAELTGHYWLQDAGTPNMYTVKDQTMRGLAENIRASKATFLISVNGNIIDYTIDINYKWEDNVKGELFRPFEITPPVFVNFTEKSYVFPDNNSKTVRLKLRAGKDKIQGKLALQLPYGWISTPNSLDFNLDSKEEEKIYQFEVKSNNSAAEDWVHAVATIGGQTYDKEVQYINYDHIPIQTVMRPNKAKFTKLNIITKGKNIGYIMGAGDEIPASLRQLGFEVKLLNDNDITKENLKQFDAIITGIRVYNTNEKMKFHQPVLYDYVNNGGTLIVQYNNNSDLYLNDVAPFSMKLSRDRVTKENAAITILKPDHWVLNTPNKITQKDFEGWIQERGLYFANQWDNQKLETIIACNDPNETPKDGGMLIGNYGKGKYIFSAYAWFRQLPAGVSGAYRIFANMIAGGK